MVTLPLYKDRLTHVGGAVCLVTNNKTVTTVPVPVPDIFSDLEILAIDILNSTPPTRVITCYSLPLTASSQANFDYMTRLITCLDILSDVNDTHTHTRSNKHTHIQTHTRTHIHTHIHSNVSNRRQSNACISVKT